MPNYVYSKRKNFDKGYYTHEEVKAYFLIGVPIEMATPTRLEGIVWNRNPAPVFAKWCMYRAVIEE